MAKTDYSSFEEYAASFSADVQAVLHEVRSAILAGVPGPAEEVISYQIPAVKFYGFVFYYSAHTRHYSLSCPPPFAAFTEFSAELAGYKQSKSAVQLPYDEPVPVDLITRMARFQSEKNLERSSAGRR